MYSKCSLVGLLVRESVGQGRVFLSVSSPLNKYFLKTFIIIVGQDFYTLSDSVAARQELLSSGTEVVV